MVVIFSRRVHPRLLSSVDEFINVTIFSRRVHQWLLSSVDEFINGLLSSVDEFINSCYIQWMSSSMVS